MIRLGLGLLLLLATPAQAALDLSRDALLRDHLWRQLNSMPKERRPVVGLVLSAGSLRGTAHAGVIAVLENAGFPVDVVAGTSMGAIMGALYAAGRTASDMKRIAISLRWSSGSNVTAISLASLMLTDKLLSSKRMEDFVREQIGGRRIEELAKPFACVAMDLYSGEAIIFRRGDLALAVRASMNLPGFFTPVEYRHRYLVDGGVVSYIPIDAARLLGAEWILASVTELDYTRSRPQNVLESLEQVIDIRGSLLSRDQRKQADFLIEPPVGDIGMYEFARIEEAVDKGTIAANKKIKRAMESLVLFSLPRMMADFLPEAPGRAP